MTGSGLGLGLVGLGTADLETEGRLGRHCNDTIGEPRTVLRTAELLPPPARLASVFSLEAPKVLMSLVPAQHGRHLSSVIPN